MKSRIHQIKEALKEYGAEKTYLFGSWARGEGDDLSDLDMVIIKRTDTPFFERLREVSTLLPLTLGGVDVLVYTPEEFAEMEEEGNAFIEMILEEGILI